LVDWLVDNGTGGVFTRIYTNTVRYPAMQAWSLVNNMTSNFTTLDGVAISLYTLTPEMGVSNLGTWLY